MKSSTFKGLLIIVLLVFSTITVLGIHTAGGVIAMVGQHLNGPVGWQIFADLFIALSLFLLWMWADAKKNHRNFWLWAVFTLTCGSFGPLLYLLTSSQSPKLSS